MKHIEFRLLEVKPKTEVYRAINISSVFTLGTIYWHRRQYVFEPFQGTVFSSGGLREIEEFIDDLMKKRKVRVEVL